ncbi:hypothetical protein D3C76_1474310 [compost metagenome]
MRTQVPVDLVIGVQIDQVVCTLLHTAQIDFALMVEVATYAPVAQLAGQAVVGRKFEQPLRGGFSGVVGAFAASAYVFRVTVGVAKHSVPTGEKLARSLDFKPSIAHLAAFLVAR